MLRAGFPVGAHARWRTLYEIDVIAHVLLKGNRCTATRFVNHRWIQLARDNERTATRPPVGGPSINAMSSKYVRRYGKSFGGTYGWAAEISRRKLQVENSKFFHLQRIADLDGYGSRVYMRRIMGCMPTPSGFSISSIRRGSFILELAWTESWPATSKPFGF